MTLRVQQQPTGLGWLGLAPDLARSRPEATGTRADRRGLHVLTKRQLRHDSLSGRTDGGGIGVDHERLQVLRYAEPGGDRKAGHVGPEAVLRDAIAVPGELELHDGATDRAGVHIHVPVLRRVP